MVRHSSPEQTKSFVCLPRIHPRAVKSKLWSEGISRFAFDCQHMIGNGWEAVKQTFEMSHYLAHISIDRTRGTSSDEQQNYCRLGIGKDFTSLPTSRNERNRFRF